MMSWHKQGKMIAMVMPCCALWCVACDDVAAPRGDATERQARSEAAPATNKPRDPGAATYDEDAFKLTIAPTAPLEVGKQGFVQVVLEAKAPFKCNQEYPYKFQVEASDSIQPGAETVKLDGMQVAPERTQFKLAVNPKTPGEHTVGGTFSFSVCTDENCLVERKKLALQVTAK